MSPHSIRTQNEHKGLNMETTTKTITLLTKVCTKCNIEKNLTEFNFRRDTNRYRNECKSCKSKYNKQYLEENKESIYNYHREYIKVYDQINKEKIRARKQAYYQENKERISQVKKLYRQNNRDKIIKSSIEYREKNKDEIRAKNKIYKQTEKGKIAGLNQRSKRRAKIKEGSITNNELYNIIKISNNCYWCNSKLNKKEKAGYHIDHYVPLSKGGTHTIDNIVISCPDCNLEKHAKDPFEFALSKGKLL